MALRKAEMIAVLAEETGMSQKKMRECLDAIVDLVIRETAASGECTLGDLGKFKRVLFKGGRRRNPRTGGMVESKDRYVMRFKPFKQTKESML